MVNKHYQNITIGNDHYWYFEDDPKNQEYTPISDLGKLWFLFVQGGADPWRTGFTASLSQWDMVGAFEKKKDLEQYLLEVTTFLDSIDSTEKFLAN